MTNAELISVTKRLTIHLKNIKIVCNDFLSQNPIYYDPGNNYEEICYIDGQIDDIFFILNEEEINDD